MLSRFSIFKYALIIVAITGSIGLWVVFRRVTQVSFFRSFKLSAGYASALIVNGNTVQSVLIGAGESFEIVRLLGGMLPLFHNQIDYLIVPSRKDDLAGVLDVMKSFRVNTLIMLPPIASVNPITNTSTTSPSVITNKITEDYIRKFADELEIPILNIRISTNLNFENISTEIIPMFLRGNDAAQYLGLIIKNSVSDKSINKSQNIIIVGKSTKAQNRYLLQRNYTESIHQSSTTEMHVVMFQTLSVDNIDIELLQDLNPSTVVVSDYVHPKKSPKSTKSKNAAVLKVNMERVIAEQGISIKSLYQKPFNMYLNEYNTAKTMPGFDRGLFY